MTLPKPMAERRDGASGKCDRCGELKELAPLFITARPGMTWPTLMPPVPEPEHVCFDCLAVDEIARPLNQVVLFCLTWMRDTATNKTAAISLDHVRSYFVVRNNTGSIGRDDAIRALRGLLDHHGDRG